MEVSINGGTPIAGWFVVGNPTKKDDLVVPLFRKTPIELTNKIEKLTDFEYCELEQIENDPC